MKNKLLKTLTCFASISAIGSTIAISSTGCGCSNKESIKALPESVYEIDANNVLHGFKEGIDLSQYEGICDTIRIPASVTSIGDDAFYKPSQTTSSTIPQFITKLIFPKKSNCSSIGMQAFDEWHWKTSVSFPGSLIEFNYMAFDECFTLSSITWNSWKGPSQTTFNAAFRGFPDKGTVTVTNPVDGNDSSELLQFLKDEVNLPDGWTAA